MGLFDFFWKPRPTSASTAKERLSIIVAHERAGEGGFDYLPRLKQEILQVLARYQEIDLDHVSVNIGKTGGCDVLELNVVIGAGSAQDDDLASVFP